jgi:hypothetical protein
MSNKEEKGRQGQSRSSSDRQEAATDSGEHDSARLLLKPLLGLAAGVAIIVIVGLIAG